MRLAIIGAGISGLTLAQELSPKAQVTVFEKARGVGGRIATRRVDPFCFDHGAQFFTVRTQEFQTFLQPFMDAGIVAAWSGETLALDVDQKEKLMPWPQPRWVAAPNMNSLTKLLARNLDVRISCEVAPLLNKHGSYWQLANKEGALLGDFDWIISTAPAAQSLRLMGQHIGQQSPLRSARMQGCFALMIGLPYPWDKPWTEAICHHNFIRSIFVCSSKPGRDAGVTSLTVHSTNDWAQAHMDHDLESIKRKMHHEFLRLTGIKSDDIAHLTLHRWRYAVPATPRVLDYEIDSKLRLAAVGDWGGACRIEEVWRDARECAGRIASALGEA
ncbi:MAG: NAD(P)-binding protein [Pseudomonadota bacterium]|nr:NAD(P)-binding protein [Pseudomonadota bacterium]